MDWSLISPLMMLALWLLTSCLLLNIGKYIVVKYPATPTIWWVILGLSVLPILPVGSSSEIGKVPKVLLEFGGYIEQKQHQVGQLSVQNIPLSVDVLLYIIFAVYLVIAMLRLNGLCRSWLSMRRLLITSEPFAHSMSKVPCVQIPITCSPFVFGLSNSKIVLPSYFSQLSAEQQNTLVCHEVTHIQHKDHIALLIWSILGCVFWFNPFIKQMEKGFIHAMELRCDLKTLRGYDINKKHYATTLMAVLKRSIAANTVPSTANFSSDALSLEDYKLRLQEIIQPQTNKPVYLIATLLFVSIVLGIVNIKAAPALYSATEQWQNPLTDFRISSYYGHISEFRHSKSHGGIDLVAPVGTPVKAVSSGIVVIADATTLSANLGNVVLVQHKNGYQSLYAHLDTITVEQGVQVKAGSPLGTLGATGRVTGAHLHFELLHQEQRINPLAILELK
ncbi:M23/M56 family metallopeptidase [Pseudoalteromonas luteoviolacea]|uniref:Peptidase M23 domain-containing protein n=1 Tax=Pseudoalteromonas luteoviolacea S4054 TaxID=1129367 RepID=A0A0F6AHN1_9GAMM|nr:M23/M56 family metallopeptidase [Pseudoalteromonas luteoviolacea]AOT06409.1 hypothetical protein S4054249_00220 [Pseudoalteromonas luteoviolacea]AOT11326.1 hypothetical protein S40542_00220 [Pseudoalteromonas luteoviolacea]AOT16239.1 hypothetical protein S4054_00220 [Pseudoalteromonas luteoviolacea]KKE85722.1 hypothetical protein N479_24950 [Pseudoalteromonas luteoviolacea S4054]KZN64379.1 hypothetical protein N481_25430 [Pseudoalteromonas luteoviolacea S4047-1]